MINQADAKQDSSIEIGSSDRNPIKLRHIHREEFRSQDKVEVKPINWQIHPASFGCRNTLKCRVHGYFHIQSGAI